MYNRLLKSEIENSEHIEVTITAWRNEGINIAIMNSVNPENESPTIIYENELLTLNEFAVKYPYAVNPTLSRV